MSRFPEDLVALPKRLLAILFPVSYGHRLPHLKPDALPVGQRLHNIGDSVHHVYYVYSFDPGLMSSDFLITKEVKPSP